jgi:hypothetical protein
LKCFEGREGAEGEKSKKAKTKSMLRDEFLVSVQKFLDIIKGILSQVR